MIHSIRFTAVLDTNVLFPLTIRDILFWFAHFELYTPKWSSLIFEEWLRVMERKSISPIHIQRQLNLAKTVFPDATVTNYESLIPLLSMPDENDRHVLAAAIKANANVIVTNNLRDFNPDYLATFNLHVKSPDDFLTDIIDLAPDLAANAFKAMVLQKRNPPLTELEVLDRLRANGLKDTANYIHSLI